MHVRLIVALVLAALAVVPSAAAAHSLTSWTPSGTVSDSYVFRGRAWQPGQRIAVSYFASETDPTPLRLATTTPRRDGRFTFTFRDVVGRLDTGVTASLCFRQFDTRRDRTFVRCGDFYVEPPWVRFQPSTGFLGDVFAVTFFGFRPGDPVLLTVTGPDGRTSQETQIARLRGGFEAGPFGQVWVYIGGGLTEFVDTAQGPLGVYDLVARAPGGETARTSMVLMPRVA